MTLFEQMFGWLHIGDGELTDDTELVARISRLERERDEELVRLRATREEMDKHSSTRSVFARINGGLDESDALMQRALDGHHQEEG